VANKNEQPPVCNFCGRSGDEVERLIAGPGVFICNECIEVCRNILEEEMKTSKKKGLPDFELPTPEKIKEYMDQYVIEQDDAVLNHLTKRYDIMGILGNGANFKVLEQANIESCDIFISMTEQDEVNMVSAVLAKKMRLIHCVSMRSFASGKIS